MKMTIYVFKKVLFFNTIRFNISYYAVPVPLPCLYGNVPKVVQSAQLQQQLILDWTKIVNCGENFEFPRDHFWGIGRLFLEFIAQIPHFSHRQTLL